MKPMKMEDLKYTIGGLMLAVDSYFYDDFIYFWKHDEEKGGKNGACPLTRSGLISVLGEWISSIFSSFILMV